MINLLEIIATHIANSLVLTSGIDVFYNELPDNGIKGIVIQEPREGGHVYPQIDAEIHYIKVTTREASNTLSYQLAVDCYKLFDTEAGFIEISGVSMCIESNGTPIWEKTDQQGRKYFYFIFKAITKKLN